MNQYSEEWFDFFLKEVPAGRTQSEIAFLARQFVPKSSLIDICCGDGRHAAPLAALGYDVLGVDFNPEALRRAEKRQSKADFVLGDVRNHHLPSASAHGIYCLWQSFGYYTPGENRRLLADWRRALKDGGKLVLDVYNREFFEGKDGVRHTGQITESKRLKGRRLEVHLAYPNGKQDRFDWELYSLSELEKEAADAGYSMALSCTGFDESKPVSKAEPRMQLVLLAK